MMLYVPDKQIARLSLLRDVLTPEHDILVALMLECEQLTVNYMKRAEEVDIRFGDTDSSVDYFLPFAFDQIAVDDKLTTPFCSYFERFK